MFFGLFFGFVHTLGNLLGAIIGIAISSRLTGLTADSIGFIFGGGSGANVVIFIIIFLLVSRMIALVFWILEKFTNVFKWIPFAKSMDRLLGAFLGFVEGVIMVGVIVYYAVQVLPNEALRFALENSAFAHYLLETMTLLQLFFPPELRITFGN